MLASVFSTVNTKRNKAAHKSRKFSSIGLRRAQSPPSPASFVSPEIVEINEKGPFGATYAEDPDREPGMSIDRSVTSPQIQLSFETSESLSEWLRPNIMSPENRTPPRRNVSLPNGGRDMSASSSSSKARVSPELSIKEEKEEGQLLEPNRLYVDTSVHYARSSFDDTAENSSLTSTRKPTPSPIRIPNNVTSAKIKVQRSSPEGPISVKSGSTIPPPLPTKGSRPPSPNSAITDDMMSSAISGTTFANALHVNSFIYDSRASKYKSGGMTRQDSATLPRGEHPLHNSMYLRERRASIGSPSDVLGSAIPPVPRVPSRASFDGTALGKRNSVTSPLDSTDTDQPVAPPPLKRPKSTGRLRRDQTLSMPPISPISEASSPAPSVPNTPVFLGQAASIASNASTRSLANSVTPQRSVNLEGNTSSSSLGTGEGSSHNRAATEPTSTRTKDSRKGSLVPPNGPMPGTMRSSGAYTMTNGRLAVTRTISEGGTSRNGAPQPSRPAVLLPIGERPTSVLAPLSPQPSTISTVTGPTPTSARQGSFPGSDTPVDSPDLLDSFPVQIARERATGPPPPLPLGRSSEDSIAVPTPLHSASVESVPSTALTDRQTFPETPNAFSPLWSAGFAPPSGNGTGTGTGTTRSSSDRNNTRPGQSRVPGVLDIMRSRMSGTVLTKPNNTSAKSNVRSSRVPPTPPLTGESSSAGSQPGSPQISVMEQPLPPPKRLTAIEEAVASRAVSTYSTLPEPPTSGTMFETFAPQQNMSLMAQVPKGARNRSATESHSRNGSVANNNNQSHSRTGSVAGQAQGQRQPQNSTGAQGSTPAAQAKAEEARTHRRMRSVTNPDEPAGSPPPSYAPEFDPPPPPSPLPLIQMHPRSNTADSSGPSRRSSGQSNSHLQASSSSQSSIPQKRSLSPFPTPPNSSAPSSPQPGRSRLDAHASSISVEHPPPPYVEEFRTATPSVPPAPSASASASASGPAPLILQPAPPSRLATPELPAQPGTPPRSAFNTPENTPNKRLTARSRPPLPQGPRKPSYNASVAKARLRAGSTSSLHGPGGASSSAMAGASTPRMITSLAAPRFQSSRVNFRGLTMEAAQWTLTSQQLQHIVSSAIRQSADASAIRILPLDTLDVGLPMEIERMEAHCAELKLRYRLGVRKRNTMLSNVGRVVEAQSVGGGAEMLEQGARMLEDLGDLTESLDQTAEELYTATDQLAQLHHLRDVHQRSALAMALRKLNSSFLKQVGEVQRLREQIGTLEAERDEAWREAQEVAQEFDEYTERAMAEPSPGPSSYRNTGGTDKDSITPSRRSSRVLVARKNSQRASKAGLRSMYRRSHRSSTSSNHRYSGAASPGVWSGPGGDEDIPPVPPIPSRRDLFLAYGDLPTRSSMDSPSSEIRAMVQAQKELCEMLGISLEELKSQNQGPSRRQSMSAIPGLKSPVSPAPTRRNSDIITPNHQRAFKV